MLMDKRMTSQRAIEEAQKRINHLTKRYVRYNEDILTAEERRTLSFTDQAALERERRNRANETIALLTAQQKEFKKGLKEIQNQEEAINVAKKKQIDTYTPEELGVEVAPRVKTLKVTPPAERKAGIIVESVEELVDKLRNEAKVIT